MADEKDTPESMVLWDDNHGWIVTAGIRDNGDIEICSDGVHEWYAIVPASEVKHLKSALAAVTPGSKSESVMPLLFDVFGRAPEAKNPFDDIKQFFDTRSIPWKSDFWSANRLTQAVSESADGHMKKYDIIGDIHGHGVELKGLLEKLGYKRDEDGVYAHPEPNRMAVFAGDYIDRGGENFEVIDIVRDMVNAGRAHAIMGNHELNASLFHTQHPNDKQGGKLMPLRAHGAKNVHQHQAFLDEAAQNAEQTEKNIEWIKSLPVYLELDGVRVVHALWDQPAIDFLHREGLLRDDNTVQPGRWHELSRKHTPGCDAIELLTKGVEVPLPPGVRFFDADGTRRNVARLKWWGNPDDPNLKLSDVILDVPPEVIPNIPAPDDIKARMREVQQLEDNTVFFGHYWQRGEHPTIESPNAICVDQSVAKDGHLAAATVTVDAGKILDMTFDSVKSRPPVKHNDIRRG